MKFACNIPILPLKTKIQGPAPSQISNDEDIIDEAIKYFRINVFFQNYDITCPADKVLIFVTVCIQKCLELIQAFPKLRKEGEKKLINFIKYKIPGINEKANILAGLTAKEKSPDEFNLYSNYLYQVKEETCKRILDK